MMPGSFYSALHVGEQHQPAVLRAEDPKDHVPHVLVHVADRRQDVVVTQDPHE